MRQVAALPYRSGGPGDAELSILLVTSRETKRWVIPKGNPMRGLSPHSAAAVEAEEEAGVRGPIGGQAIGAFRYLKRFKNGSSAMREVDVFPLAVTEELESWKEKGERERRWFSRADAADAVEEPDLAELIRSFQAPASQQGMVTAAAEGSGIGRMMNWLCSLLPGSGKA